MPNALPDDTANLASSSLISQDHPQGPYAHRSCISRMSTDDLQRLSLPLQQQGKFLGRCKTRRDQSHAMKATRYRSTPGWRSSARKSYTASSNGRAVILLVEF